MILLFAAEDDRTCQELAVRLSQRGVRSFIWGDHLYPSLAKISLRYGRDGKEEGHVVTQSGDTFELGDVRGIWLGRVPRATEDTRLHDPHARAYVRDEASAFLRAAWRRPGCRWVPGPCHAVLRANDKAAQLSFAGQLGFEIPPTIITNDPAEALAFHREHDGNIVSKTFSTHHIEGDDRERRSDWWFLETRMVSHRRTAAYRTIQDCPSILQAYVPKEVELRITLVGDHVFPCEIHSQVTHHTRYDWRRYDLAHTPHLEHALPDGLREKCKALLRGYGLCFGAVDMVKTPDGRYVFLELNTTAEYVWIEELTGMPISDALTDLLVLADRGEGAMVDTLRQPVAELA